jgi:hypothetical protein
MLRSLSRHSPHRLTDAPLSTEPTVETSKAPSDGFEQRTRERADPSGDG